MNSVVFLALVFITTVYAASLPLQAGKNPMTRIGQIGAKTYYDAISEGKVSWRGAQGMCEYYGLTIGTTENSAEFRYLYDARKGNDYWIGGSQKGFVKQDTLTSFEWTDGSAVPSGINFHQHSEMAICLYFSGDDHTYVDQCYFGQHYALCESKQ